MEKNEGNCTHQRQIRTSTESGSRSDTLKSKEGQLSHKKGLHEVPNHTELPAKKNSNSKQHPCHQSTDN